MVKSGRMIKTSSTQAKNENANTEDLRSEQQQIQRKMKHHPESLTKSCIEKRRMQDEVEYSKKLLNRLKKKRCLDVDVLYDKVNRIATSKGCWNLHLLKKLNKVLDELATDNDDPLKTTRENATMGPKPQIKLRTEDSVNVEIDDEIDDWWSKSGGLRPPKIGKTIARAKRFAGARRFIVICETKFEQPHDIVIIFDSTDVTMLAGKFFVHSHNKQIDTFKRVRGNEIWIRVWNKSDRKPGSILTVSIGPKVIKEKSTGRFFHGGKVKVMLPDEPIKKKRRREDTTDKCFKQTKRMATSDDIPGPGSYHLENSYKNIYRVSCPQWKLPTKAGPVQNDDEKTGGFLNVKDDFRWANSNTVIINPLPSSKKSAQYNRRKDTEFLLKMFWQWKTRNKHKKHNQRVPTKRVKGPKMMPRRTKSRKWITDLITKTPKEEKTQSPEVKKSRVVQLAPRARDEKQEEIGPPLYNPNYRSQKWKKPEWSFGKITNETLKQRLKKRVDEMNEQETLSRVKSTSKYQRPQENSGWRPPPQITQQKSDARIETLVKSTNATAEHSFSFRNSERWRDCWNEEVEGEKLVLCPKSMDKASAHRFMTSERFADPDEGICEDNSTFLARDLGGHTVNGGYLSQAEKIFEKERTEDSKRLILLPRNPNLDPTPAPKFAQADRWVEDMEKSKEGDKLFISPQPLSTRLKITIGRKLDEKSSGPSASRLLLNANKSNVRGMEKNSKTKDRPVNISNSADLHETFLNPTSPRSRPTGGTFNREDRNSNVIEANNVDQLALQRRCTQTGAFNLADRFSTNMQKSDLKLCLLPKHPKSESFSGLTFRSHEQNISEDVDSRIYTPTVDAIQPESIAYTFEKAERFRDESIQAEYNELALNPQKPPLHQLGHTFAIEDRFPENEHQEEHNELALNPRKPQLHQPGHTFAIEERFPENEDIIEAQNGKTRTNTSLMTKPIEERKEGLPKSSDRDLHVYLDGMIKRLRLDSTNVDLES